MSSSSPQQQSTTVPTTKKRGWDEIESLFDKKKEKAASAKKEKPSEKQSVGAKRNSAVKAASPSKQSRTGSSRVSNSHTSSKTEEWVDDGLGGKYNAEGYTGRVEDGVKIFKAHILGGQNNPNAGQSALCPFDCQCCYI